jgi:hypothetical protein
VSLLRVLLLIALLAAPFGRMAAAEAMPDHSAMAMAGGHCDTMPASGTGESDDRSIDCMIACAAMATAEPPSLSPPPAAAAAPAARLLAAPGGLHPEADPPPPRRS